MRSRAWGDRFVGREQELALAVQVLADAREGPRYVAVSGEPGIGKSRLLSEIRDHAAREGWTVLSGACSQTAAGSVPWQPLIDALCRDPAQDAPDPDLLAALDVLESGLGDDRPGATYRLVHAVRGALGRAARRCPLLLVIDDLQWAAPATVDLLAALVRSPDGVPLAVLTAHRRGVDEGTAVLLYEQAAARDARGTHLPLAGLGADLVALLLDSTDLDPVEALRETDGNPLMLELLTTVRRVGGADPSSATDQLLAAVPGTLAPVLALAGVVGHDVPDAVLAEAYDGDAAPLPALLASAIRLGVLVPTADGVRFRHDLLRSTVCGHLLPLHRRELHRRVAHAIERTVPRLPWSPARVTAELAHHWHEAAEPAAALRWAVRAGTTATTVHAVDEAWHHHERAALWWPRVADPQAAAGTDAVTFFTTAGHAAVAAGRFDPAVTLFREAAARCDASTPPPVAGLVWERLGRTLWDTGDDQASRTAYARAEEVLASGTASPLRIKVAAARGMSLVQQGSYRQAQRLGTDAARAARALGATDEEGYALNVVGLTLTLLGHGESGTSALERARALAAEARDWQSIHRGAANLSYALERQGRFARALDVALDGIAQLDDLGVPPRAATLLHNNAVAQLIRLGRWDEALARLTWALEQSPSPRSTALLNLGHAEIASIRGDAGTADRCLAAAAGIASEDPNLVVPLRIVQAEHLLRLGQPAAAAEVARDGLRRQGPDGDALHTVRLATLLARARPPQRRERGAKDVGAPRHADLLDLVAQAVQRGVGAHSPELDCWYEELRSECGLTPWPDTASRWEDLRTPFRHGVALQRAAEQELRRGHRDRARTLLARATQIADDLGADGLRASCLALGARAGLGAPERLRTAHAGLGLTAREQDVLALVARGSTNEQVARALFISTRTAAVHVSSLLRKFQVQNRAQLAAAVHDIHWTKEKDDV